MKDNGIMVLDVQHVLGWFWVKSNPLLSIVRHAFNVIMVPVHWGLTTWLFEYAGMGELLWKIRKTFFESLIIIGRKGRVFK